MLDRVLQVRLVQGCLGDHQEIVGPVDNQIAETIISGNIDLAVDLAAVAETNSDGSVFDLL